MGSRKVMIQVIGTSRGENGETDRTEVTVLGVYSCQNGKHFILYEEDDGEGRLVRNMVKIAEDSFEVIKKGNRAAHMVFRAGERARSWYETPYGSFSMVLCVKEVEIRLAAIDEAGAGKSADAGAILVRASYTVELDGAAVSENEVLLNIYGADSGRD